MDERPLEDSRCCSQGSRYQCYLVAEASIECLHWWLYSISVYLSGGAKSCSGPIFDFRKRPFSSETGTKYCSGEEALKTTFFSHSIDEMRGSVSPCFADFFRSTFRIKFRHNIANGKLVLNRLDLTNIYIILNRA